MDDNVDATDKGELTIESRLAFLRAAEALKNVLRSGHTSTGRPESTAEHSWRLCLMALVLEDRLDGLDMLKVLKLCIVHDLAEAISGDIPAVAQVSPDRKRAQEEQDLLLLTAPLDPPLKAGILSLWEEYEQGATPEAGVVKAMDKLETILQHNQGKNPPDFDYAFNLRYGQQYTASHPLFADIRKLLDADTRRRMHDARHAAEGRAGCDDADLPTMQQKPQQAPPR
ncbi:MAG TPA: HD domain-containing protein [Noviherbaspirillum sp.]|jgi:putative hydrolase of HD superfamily|uniref:HD domain-containing protein n=1 Tax=Noviherbaspirillum sp. TaxID=1926288 RepID=UPI002F92ADB4